MRKHSKNVVYRKANFARKSARARQSRLAAARGPVPLVCLSVVILLSGALAGAAGPPGPLVPRYTIIDLGTLGGFSSVALGINELGQVCGGADRSDGLRRAFLWTDGEMIDLGTFAEATQGEANDVNNNGQVTGTLFSSGAGVVGAFFWDAGEIINLGDLTGVGAPTQAYAMNDSGQVVGQSKVSLTEAHAFLWQDGVMTDLTANGFCTGIARDISNAGHIVGGACLWEDGVVTNLGSLGGTATGALGMNELRQVVGGSDRVPGSFDFYAFLWDNGQMIDLDVGPGGIAEAVNNSGQVIIPSRFLFDPQHGVLDLSELIPSDSGWFSLDVRDINDAAQIVGGGTFNGARRAFLMTPIPPPPIPAVSAWGTVVMGLLVLCAGGILGRRLKPTPFSKC